MPRHEEFDVGLRIMLVRTDDPYTELRPGDLGTVANVDGIGTLHVCWDRGSHLGMNVDDREDWPAWVGKDHEVPDVIIPIPGPPRFCDRCTSAQVLVSTVTPHKENRT